MPRQNRPWFRSERNAWYANINGKQTRLAEGAENEAKAFVEFVRLKEKADQDNHVLPAVLRIRHICTRFLSHSEKHNDERTFKWYKLYLDSFCSFRGVGDLLVADARPIHVTEWLDGHPSWKNSRRGAITCIKRAFNWAVDEGLLNASPFKRVKKPPVVPRDRFLTVEERKEIFNAIKDAQFRDFVFAMQETGCRPSELRKATAANYDKTLKVLMFWNHKTAKRTGKPRVVYLTAAMVALVERLVEQYPEGPLFRGPRSKRGFTRNGIRCRFMRLRQKLPHLKHFISYSYRHAYATDALMKGLNVAQVSELLGHTDTEMVMKHYGHLRLQIDHLRDAAKKVTGESD